MVQLFKVAVSIICLFSSAVAADYTIKLSHIVSPLAPKGMGANFFAKRVSDLTYGKVEVIIYPDSQLYGDDEEMKAFKNGDVQMIIPSLSKFASIVPETQLFDLPFLFRDRNHLYKVLDGEVGKTLKDKVTAKGFVVLDYWDAGFKQFSSKQKALLLPQDAAGQKFRTMNSPVLEAQFKALGASAQVLPFSGLYAALKQGIVEGAENPLSNFSTQKFYEVQTDLTLSNHGYLGYMVVMNENFWKKLPSDLKSMVLQAVKEATEFERMMASEDDRATLAKIEEYGRASGKLKVHRLNPDQQKTWQTTLEKIYPQFYSVIGEDLIKKVQAIR